MEKVKGSEYFLNALYMHQEDQFVLSCSLVNVKPFDDDDVWRILATEYFRRAVSNKARFVHVVHVRKDGYVVDLYERENITSQSS